MRFSKAGQVREVVEQMREVDKTAHSFNRSRILEVFEGFPPFSQEEAEQEHVGRNINFLEAPGLAHKARATWNNAFLKPGNRCKITLDSGPVHKRAAWSASITKNLNRPLKRNLRYIEAIRATGAQVIMHGIGPKWWESAKCWTPHEIGIEDLLVPSNTRVNLENLSHFAIFRRYTPEELYRMTHKKNVDPGWNMAAVNAELKRLAGTMTGQQDSLQDTQNFEKLVKYYKANAGILDTDCVPTCNVWDFFYQEEDDERGRWYRCMILVDSPNEADSGFLYRSKRPYAGNLSQILHIQFGDGAQAAPFLYHTVRSLGFLLYAVCHLQNQLRCRFMDAIFEATMQLFRVHNAEDRARLQKVDLQHMGLVPVGLDFVKNEERWMINENLVVAGLSQNRQLMAENAASFVQDSDSGTQKELTATEVMARLQSANTLVSSLLSMAYTYDRFELMEIARRFCLKDTLNPDIEGFRRACLRDGVPEAYLNCERWDIEPERVLGAGNKTLELAQAETLMNRIEQFDPEAQADIRREWVLAVTDNPDQAQHWVPTDEQNIPVAGHDAQLAVGALMNGAPVAVRQGIDHISYVNAMIQSMQSMVEDILVLVQHGHQPQAQQVMGLTNCYKHVIGHIEIVAQNEAEKQRVKQWGDALKQIMNFVKSWGQQIDEMHDAQAQQNGDGGKTAATIIKAQTDAKIKEGTAAQKMQHKNAQFLADQQRRNVQTMSEVQRQKMLADAQVESLDKSTAARIRTQRMAAFNNPRKSSDE